MKAVTQYSLWGARFDRRFLEDYVGKAILNDPKVALIELIANSWDANATEVQIKWPDRDGQEFFIEDNGCGLTETEFNDRWMVLSYDRTEQQGIWAEQPQNSSSQLKKRRVFGRNGKGRHAAFCFSDEEYFVESWKAGNKFLYRVFIPKDGLSPISCERISESKIDKHSSGTKIYSKKAKKLGMSAEDMRRIIGMRFLSDPDFGVWINKTQITFEDVPSEHVTEYEVKLANKKKITITKIDVKDSDKTTRQHGIAWQVNGRLVGNVDWNTLGDKSFIDGRKSIAKRFSFIVKADHLAELVEADWSGFKKANDDVSEAFSVVGEKIKEIIYEASKLQRQEAVEEIVIQNKDRIQNLAPNQQNTWLMAVTRIQQECPSLSEQDIQDVSAVLAKMEVSRSQYSLLNKLKECSVDDLDALDQILETWTIEAAKVVLDELEVRLKLIDELINKVNNHETDELKDLQPLFEKGLWIFGPEFEAVGFTSNRGMTSVIREIFHSDEKGSRLRPDFVITPDSTLGFYSYPQFDPETGEELGPQRLVIVELKAPAVALGTKELTQTWKYVTELLDKGLILPSTVVTCYVLGRTIQRHNSETIHHGANVHIVPMTFETILSKARNRTHRLYDKIKDNAPFLNSESQISEILAGEDAELNFKSKELAQ